MEIGIGGKKLIEEILEVGVGEERERSEGRGL